MKVYFVVSPDGEVWKDTARLSYDDARNAFVKGYLSIIENYVTSHACWEVWNCFQKAGFKMQEIEVPEQ